MWFTKLQKRTYLEREIDEVHKILSKVPPDSHEYTMIVENLDRLYKAKSESKKSYVSRDTIVIVIGNLLGIVLILGYEKANIVTSKAIQFVLRGRA
jgi:hypothetical protein